MVSVAVLEDKETARLGIAQPHHQDLINRSYRLHSIRKIGLCAGSGGSMFKGLKADLYFTGELSHHLVVAAKENGISVITCTFPHLFSWEVI